ncbi:HNH endonuclease [Niabella sp. CC-SYL272]|uniref:NUMOD4 domain-containing protein n=1 Tax=Niabella agricola TaxID=2891571 RepID=UPI001F29B085|nr:NUMOD4 domain-containing protein [Niabella agricola]MCF3107292.1 HNH endonuclease [Niabella agricola]
MTFKDKCGQIVTCKNCKIEFVYSLKNRVFCSVHCRDTYNWYKPKMSVCKKIENIDGEVWKIIPGYQKYMVSSIGRIKSVDKKWLTGEGYTALRQSPERILRTHLIHGYLKVALCKNGIEKGFAVHRLVAAAFIPNPSGKPQVNHINGIKYDNRVENLEWVTGKENVNHAIKIGLWKKKRKKRVYLNDDHKREVVVLYKSGIPILKISETLGVPYTSVYSVVKKYKSGASVFIKGRKVLSNEYGHIVKLREEGVCLSEVSKMYGVSPATISLIVKKYKHIQKVG